MIRRSVLLSVAMPFILTMMVLTAGTLAAGTTAGGHLDHHAGTTPRGKSAQKKPRMGAQRQAAFNGAAARLSQSGVTCENEAPSDAVRACEGKSAGDACTVEHEERSFTGQCALIPGGVLACLPPPPPPPSQGAIDACAGKAPGDSCLLETEEHSTPGLCRTFASGVVACVKAPASLLAAIDACTGKAAGDACTFVEGEDESETGSCSVVERLGETLVCVPAEDIPPAVTACEGLHAGDACSFDHHDVILTGTCVMPPGQSILVCQQETPPGDGPCAGRTEGDACSFVHDDESVDGTCTAILGQLACVPNRVIPPAVAACSGSSVGDNCTFTRDGRTFNGACAAIPDHDLLICVPPPPQALIDACVGKAAGDACSATLGDRQFTGTCATALDGVTLVCLPTGHGDDDDQGDDDQGDGHPGRIAACHGLPAGALCSVMVGDKVQNGTCRSDDDDNEAPLACLPPAPPQEALDACTGLVSGDACSFPWKGVTVTGACRPLPGGAALVCAPLCPHPHRDGHD